MIKIILSVLLICFRMSYGNAQQLLRFQSYDSDKMSFSSALTGVTGRTEINSGIYRQWLGFSGAPASEYLSVQKNFGYKTALGLSLNNFRFGNFNQFSLRANYSYKLKMSRFSNLFFGFNALYERTRLNTSGIISQGNDPIIQNSQNTGFGVFDFGAAVAWKYSDFIIGISIPELITSDIKIKDGAGNYCRNRYYHFHSSYIYNFNKEYSIEPTAVYSFSGKMSSKNTFWQVSFLAEYQKIIGVGMAYSGQNGVSIILKFISSGRFSVQYNYTFGSQNPASVSLGSHGISIGFIISDSKKQNEPVYVPQNNEYIPKIINNNVNSDESKINKTEIDELRDENENIRLQSNKILHEHQQKIDELEQKLKELEKNKSESSQNTNDRQDKRKESLLVLHNIKFSPNSDKLYSSSFPELNILVNQMVLKPEYELHIAVFNNEQFSNNYNKYLSEKRAAALRDYFVNRGINPQRIVAEGRGNDNLSADVSVKYEVQFQY